METGRWCNIPLNQRVCKLCNSGQMSDEFHYILECKELLMLRHKYFEDKYCSAPTASLCFVLMVQLWKNCHFIIKIYSLINYLPSTILLFFYLYCIYCIFKPINLDLLPFFSFIKCAFDFWTVYTVWPYVPFHGLSEYTERNWK